MAAKITIPVEIQAQSASMQNIVKELEKAASSIDITSSLGKKYTTLLKKIKQEALSYANIALQPTIDAKDLNVAKKAFSNFQKYISQIGTELDYANIFDFKLSESEITTLNNFTDTIRRLNKELTQLKTTGSKRSVEDYLTSIGESATLDRVRSTSQRFRGSGTFTANRNAITAEAAAAADNRSRLEAERVELQAVRVNLDADVTRVQGELRTAERQLERTQAIVNRGNFLSKFTGLNEKIIQTKGGQVRGQTAVLSAFMEPFESGAVGGRLAETNRAGAETVLKALGLDQATIDRILPQQITYIRQEIARHLNIQDGSTDAIAGTTISRLANVQARARSYMAQYATDERYAALGAEQQQVNTLTGQLRRAQTEVSGNQEAQDRITEEIAEIDTLITNLNSINAALQRFQEQLNNTEIANLNQQIQEQTNLREKETVQIRSRRRRSIQETVDRSGTDNADYMQAVDSNIRQADLSVQEAEQFQQNLKQAVSHWFGAQQIITLVKDGLRQAWTDIQGLDKAMTNIAVVTDMSVSDLWGKINQYMAIAQDYGVTTQGVYEVSQLYYQQGLSASEVMEATTETLKMARIAGMDYAEAADAMTVAIRAFKMEMSDAQVITDVYSKVAAVTASDSQELAIAMSKTASSAESVGSSFENTTAMLAVMIETTRESAQNLGSALKSIISRYGEMKAGLTVDSEGEVIDYNKVDTALKSVGISIKDTQGQFRNFDDVIFELSEKWDTLDKNTQRYIATIMAGNRQQSRFIALVDNWERLEEVSGAAHDSADAGLLQYAKTLDSLETKLNALSTSFQQFYMNIVNGDTFKWLIDLVTNVLNGLNKIGTSTTILTGVTLVKTIKTFSSFVLGNFSGLFSEIRKNYKALQDDLTRMAREGAAERRAIEEGSAQTYTRQNNPQVVARREQEASLNKYQGYIQAANIAGSIATVAGTALTGAGYERTGSITTGVGNTLSAAGTGGTLGMAIGTAFGGPAGAAIGAKVGSALAAAIAGALSLSDIIDVFSRKIEFEIEKAKKKAEEKNLDRAKAAEEERNLKTTIENLEKLQKARYQSVEAEQAYIDASKEALAAFPELEAQFSSSGDIWIDVLNNTENSERLLAEAREKTVQATLEAAAAERDQAVKEEEKAKAELAKIDSEKISSLGVQLINTLAMSLGSEDSPYNLKISEDEFDVIWENQLLPLRELSSVEDFLKQVYSLQEVFGFDDATMQQLVEQIFTTVYGSEYDNLSEILGAINTKQSNLSEAQKKRDATDEAAILAYLNKNDKINTQQKDILANWIKDKITDADFQENNFIPTTEGLAEGIAEYEAAFSDFGEEQKKIFDEAVVAFQKGQKTPLDLASIITDFFGGYDKVPQVIKEWLTQQSSDFSKQAENFGATLFKGDEKNYSTALKEIPSAFYSIITDYSNWLTANVKSTDNPLDSTKATDSLDDLLNIMAGATNEELALLGQSGTDITSITGLHNFISTLKKSGVSEERLKAWENFTPAVQNFTTEWASFSDTATSQMQLFEEKVGKAISGMDIKDATEMAGHLGITLADFSVRNGKFFLDNLEVLEEKYIAPLEKLAADITAADVTGKYSDLAKEATENLKIYERDLYLQFYLANGKFEEVVALFEGLTDNEKNEFETYLKTGEGKLSADVTAAIQPHLETINKIATDSLSNVWSAVAGAFGTDAKFFANETNRHIYQQLVEDGILTGENDVYALNENLDEETLRNGLKGKDTSLRNKVYQSWHDQKDKSTALFEDLYNGKGEVDYSYLNDLATKLNADAYGFIKTFFDQQANGMYKLSEKSAKKFKDFLISQGYTEEQIEKVLNEATADRISSKKSKKDFLQGINLDSTIEDLMEADEEGWLKVTSEMLKNIENGKTTVYDELVKAFASQDDFKIGETIRLDELTSELNDTFNSLLSDPLSASVEDLRDLHYKATGVEANAGETYAYFNAIQQAKDGNVELLRQYIIGLAQQASLKGFDIDFQIINNTLSDTAQQLASEIFENLESAIEGTLSATNMYDLSQKLNIDVERYAQATIDGYKVTTDGMLKLGTEMMKQYGETYGVAEKMFDLFVGESGVYKGYRDIVKAADKTTAEYKAQKKLLTDMAKIAMFNPDDPLFNFMDQDPSRGMALTAQSMVDTIDKVKEAFSTLKDGENIAATDFYNMMDFMYDQLGSWDNFANALGISDATLAKLEISTTEGANIYEKFVNAIVSNSKILGEVDADVLMNLGLSAENMSKGMSESLKAVADDQIKQLEAMKTTLLAMKELEKLDIDLGLGVKFGDQEAQLFNFADFLGLGQDEDLIKAVNKKLGDIKSEFSKTDSTRIGLTQDDWEKIFGADGIVNAENEQEITAAQNIGKFFNFLKGITEQEATEFARRLDALDESGKIDMSKLLTQVVETDDWTQFAKGLSADIQAAIDTAVGQINEIEVSANGKYKLKDNHKFTDDLAQQIRDIYAANGYQAVEVGMNGEEIEVHIIDAKVKAMIDASRMAENAIDWQYDFSSQTYKATIESGTMNVDVEVDKFGTVTYKNQGDPITDSTVEEMLNNSGINIKKTVSGENQTLQLDLTAAPGAVDATTTIAENVAGIKTILEEGIEISINTEQAAEDIETITTLYKNLVQTIIDQPLVLSTVGGSLSNLNPNAQATNEQGQTQKELPTLEQKIQITWEGKEDWKDQDWEQSVKLNYTGIGSWKRYNQTQDVTVNYTVGTVEKPNLGGTGGSTQTQSEKPKEGEAKGNVNLLKLGAAYARGTLMGELGPELYVQKGAYHIAGAHGPEFVDLDPDAIVFNHLQTANLLGKGHTSKTGSPVVSERRSVAFATGNVSGPAMASGLDDAIAAIDRAIAMWQNIANSTTKDLLSGSGKHKGGGSGNTLKAVTEELQEWYNLSRQIADIEQDINNLLAERENIEWSNGAEYLKSLREQQKLLNKQIATQQVLLDFQKLQLERQAKHIKDNKIWSQFLTIGEDGLLQYTEGNETNDGKGALQVLQELNQMSAKEQEDYLKSIGYSYTTNDGKKLEGQELVEQFFQELQDQIDQYDSLYDTVNGTEETLEKLRKDIKDINDQIKENQMDLEEAVYDIIVEAWEKEIEQMEKQADLIKEANDAYIEGLNEALSAERKVYDENQKIADRESLQRRLSLLRRSGGSASEIADLESQLNDMLKEEYFSNQEKMIESIQKANDMQIQQLDTQIRLQEEALQFQKEHGIIWTQVYEVLSGTREEILAFMQGRSTEFFSQSLLQQEQMLTEWAHKIGIYTENRKYENYVEHSRKNVWENDLIWNNEKLSEYKSIYESLSDNDKNTIRDQFTSVYAQARLDGKDHETAVSEAAEAVAKTLKEKKKANESSNNKAPSTTPNPQGSGGSSSSSSGSSSGGSSTGGTTEAVTHWAFTFNGNYKHCYRSKANAEEAINDMYNSYLKSLLKEAHGREEIDQANITADRAKKKALNTLASGKHPAYKHGGLVDFTGPAIVHGSKSRPEAFLNAEQTAQIREGLKESGKGGALEGIKAALLKLDSSIKAVTNISNKTESNSYTIAPGAVVIQVEQLNDAYDVDTLSADIMNRIYAIGNKSTNRGVSRR